MISVLFNDAFLAAVGINILLAAGLYPMVVTGQLSLGQAGFMAVGAYGSSWANVHLGWPILPSILLGILVAAVVAVPVAIGANRTRGIYLIIGTLAVGEIIQVVLGKVDALGGASGYKGMGLVGHRQIGVACLVMLGVMFLVMRSPAGVAMRSIRDDEDAAAAAGVATRSLKIGAVVFGAAVTGLAGALLAHNFTVINPTDFGVETSFDIALFVLIGGSDSLLGPGLGAFLLTYLPTAFGAFHHYRLVLDGLFLLAVMIFTPRGLITRDRTRMALRLLPPSLRRAPRARVGHPGELDGVAGGSETSGRLAPIDGTPVLALEGLSKRFSGVVALKDVDLVVRRGEIVGLIGPNGAGKTTLVNVATGLLRATGGTVSLLGGEVTSLPAHRRTRAGMGRTFQQVRLFANLTALENVSVSARARSDGADGAAGLLQRLGVLDFADRLPGELAYGIQRKVQVAQALGPKPSVLFLDEPSIGLNATELSELGSALTWIRDQGTAIVLVDHNLDLVMSLADRVVVLDHGEKLAEGTPERVRANPEVQVAYLGAPPSARSAEPRRTEAARTDASKSLEVEGLVARYGPVEALHGVSINVERGETVAVIGRNGAGKTTLLRSIFGYVRPAEGSVRFDQAELGGRPPHSMARAGVAYVPEGRGILGSLSVLENLQLAALGARRPEREHLSEVFALFPVLRERAQDQAAVLSGGQQQMLALGRALMTGPKLLMLDEPSLGLAPKVVDDLFVTLAGLRDRGMTILLVEQNVRRALSVASRGYLMNLGRVELEAEAGEILEDPRLYAAYLGGVAEGSEADR